MDRRAGLPACVVSPSHLVRQPGALPPRLVSAAAFRLFRVRACQLSAPHPEAKSEVPPAIDGGRGGAAPVTAAESGKEAGRNFYWFVSRQCYDTTAPRPVANMTHMCEVRSFWASLVSATCDYIETRTSVEQGIAYSLYQFYSLSHSEDCIFQLNATSI